MTEPSQSGKTLIEQLLDLRDHQREERGNGLTVIRGDEAPWEQSPIGAVKWFTHPLLRDRAISSLMIYEQKLPPGGRGARMQYPGGMVVYVIEGHGHTVIDGQVFPWVKDTVIQLPLRPDGIVYQHVNDDPEHQARLLCAEPNTVDSLGVDRGSGFEILEKAPDA